MHVVQRKNTALNFLSGSVCDSNLLNFWMQKLNPLWSTHQVLGQICQKEYITADTVSLKIRCSKRMKFGLAGQHHPVIVEIDGRRLERTYSLTQLDDEHVKLTLKKVPNGIVSTWLCDTSKIGDVIEFGMPYGDMLPQNYDDKQLILLAAGSGITPMYSMLYALAKSGELANYQVHLLYWVKYEDQAAFVDIFDEWSQKYPQFKYDVFYTQSETSTASRLNEEHAQEIENLDHKVVFACGPSGFVQLAKEIFQDAKLFDSEAFSLSPIENTEEGTVQVTLARSNKVLEIPKGQSILDALENANEKPISGCRMGICNKCACHKVTGTTKNVATQAENSEPGSLLRICVNSAKSDLVLDL